jgi:hypothetical protein
LYCQLGKRLPLGVHHRAKLAHAHVEGSGELANGRPRGARMARLDPAERADRDTRLESESFLREPAILT